MKLVQKGFIWLPALVAAAIIASTAFLIYKTEQVQKTLSPSPSPFVSDLPATPSPSPSPTTTPSPSPSAKPTSIPTPTKSPTPKPSPTPPAQTTVPTNNQPGNGYSRITVATDRGNFKADVIVLTNPKMVTDTANDADCQNDCPTKQLGDYVSQNGAFAGINGTYFCPPDYPDCSGKKASFDFPVYNTRLNKWINQDKLFWNSRSIIYQDGSGFHFLKNAKDFGGQLNAGIVNYPGLLDSGNVIVDDFPLSDKLNGKNTKGGIGLKDNNTIYLVIAYAVDSHDFAALFKAIGAKYALNIDGGGSSAMWYGGYKVGPGRALPNAVVFK